MQSLTFSHSLAARTGSETQGLNHKRREEQIWPKAACAFVPSAFLEVEPRHTPLFFKGILLVHQFCSTLEASQTEISELKSASLFETMSF